MRSKNTKLKKSIYHFVNDWKREYGKSPSLKVIVDNFGLNKSTIYRYLLEMDNDGEIVYDGTSIDIKELNHDNMRLARA